MHSCPLLIFFKSKFLKNSFWNTIRVTNSLDQDQAHFVGPDLGPNCLQRLSADDTSRQRVNINLMSCCMNIVIFTYASFCVNFRFHDSSICYHGYTSCLENTVVPDHMISLKAS